MGIPGSPARATHGRQEVVVTVNDERFDAYTRETTRDEMNQVRDRFERGAGGSIS
jgi:hypothetical protein